MRSKISFKGLLLTGGILFFSVMIFSLTLNPSSQASYSQPTILKKQTKTLLPTRLKIPNLKIDIPLEHVGITRL